MAPYLSLFSFNYNLISKLDFLGDPSPHHLSPASFLSQLWLAGGHTALSVQRCHQMLPTQHCFHCEWQQYWTVRPTEDKTIPRMPGISYFPQSEWRGWGVSPQAICCLQCVEQEESCGIRPHSHWQCKEGGKNNLPIDLDLITGLEGWWAGMNNTLFSRKLEIISRM